jgi:hypothetical protein
MPHDQIIVVRLHVHVDVYLRVHDVEPAILLAVA